MIEKLVLQSDSDWVSEVNSLNGWYLTYIGILVGLIFAIIGLVSWTEYKLSQKEIEKVEKDLQGSFDTQFKKFNDKLNILNFKVDNAPTSWSEEYADGVLVTYGWDFISDYKRAIRIIRSSNIEIWELSFTIKNNKFINSPAFIVIPENSPFKIGYYTAYLRETHQFVPLYLDKQHRFNLMNDINLERATLDIDITSVKVTQVDKPKQQDKH